jgi:glycosyltransferase involved in cell wall biosynthesis
MARRSVPRILMLLENSPFSQDGRVRRESFALRDAGYSVMVICPRAEGERRIMDFDGVRAYQYRQPAMGSGILGYVFEYGYSMMATFLLSLYVCCRHGFDVVHAHNPPDFFVMIAGIYKLFGTKFIFDHHDTAPDLFKARFGEQSSKLLYMMLLFFERLSCRIADHVIATNESHKRLEIERSGIDAKRITIVRNGPEAMHFRPVAPHSSLRDRDAIVIGYVGEMGKQDGIDYLIRALARLRHDLEREDWICVLVGSGEALEQLKQLARKVGVWDRVVFTGRVTFAEVVAYVSGMDICTAPDPWNSYNDRCTMIKVMEYMAQSKPVVGFDLVESRFSAGDAAIYVEPNDELAFAQALAVLLDDPELRARLGTVGRARAESELAWRHFAPRLVSVYDELTGQRRPRAVQLDAMPAGDDLPQSSINERPPQAAGSNARQPAGVQP